MLMYSLRSRPKVTLTINGRSKPKKERQLMSKKQQKMVLVAQRLRDDDDDDDDDQNCNPLIFILLQHHSERNKLKFNCDDFRKQNCLSESTHGTRNKFPSTCDDSPKENCTSTATNPVRHLDEDSLCHSDEILIPSVPSSNRNKYGSHKRAMVISDDESQQDEKMQCLIQPKESFSQNGCHGGTKKKKLTCNDSNNSASLKIIGFAEQPAEDKLLTPMDRAIKVQANLSAAYPSFVKTMLPSHVSGGFWLGLSTNFCEVNLPKQDCTIVLVDEAGEEFKTKYLVNKRGLSGGWRGFSIHQALQKGDVLVFHLIHPTKFKVYIIREDRLNEIDGALELLGLDTCAGQIISGTSTQKVLHTEDSPPIYSSPSNSDIEQPEVLDGIRFSDSDTNFKDIKDFNNFNIIVEGLVIDSKFSRSNRKKYYDLCLSQNSFLHQHLLKGLNCNLIIGIILETVNIADAIRACDSSTSIEDLKTWKTTLNGFELVGMKVDFLCNRLNQLMHIASESNQLDASNMSKTYTLELARANGRMKALEDKLAELKGVMEKIDSEIEAEMTASVQKYKSKVKQIENFPW